MYLLFFIGPEEQLKVLSQGVGERASIFSLEKSMYWCFMNRNWVMKDWGETKNGED